MTSNYDFCLGTTQTKTRVIHANDDTVTYIYIYIYFYNSVLVPPYSFNANVTENIHCTLQF